MDILLSRVWKDIKDKRTKNLETTRDHMIYAARHLLKRPSDYFIPSAEKEIRKKGGYASYIFAGFIYLQNNVFSYSEEQREVIGDILDIIKKRSLSKDRDGAGRRQEEFKALASLPYSGRIRPAGRYESKLHKPSGSEPL